MFVNETTIHLSSDAEDVRSNQIRNDPKIP